MPEENSVIKHFTATVFIVADSKVLLHEHKKIGTWLPPGGHVEANELPNETALREIKEETGLDIDLIADENFAEEEKFLALNDMRVKTVSRPWKVLLEKITENHYHIDFIYLAKVKINTIENNENHQLKWFTTYELEQNQKLFPNVKYYGIKAIQEF